MQNLCLHSLSMIRHESSLAGLAAALFLGCASSDKAVEADAQARAQVLSGKAFEIREADPARALELFKEALELDPLNGALHNNCGILFFKQGAYYEAAWHLETAVRLLPQNAEPHANLGEVYERVGRLDDAAEEFEKAIALNAESLVVIENLARVNVRLGRKQRETDRLLKEVLLRETREEWRAWAQDELVKIRGLGPELDTRKENGTKAPENTPKREAE